MKVDHALHASVLVGSEAGIQVKLEAVQSGEGFVAFPTANAVRAVDRIGDEMNRLRDMLTRHCQLTHTDGRESLLQQARLVWRM